MAAVAGGAAAAVGARGARQPPRIGAAATSCRAGGLAAPQALRGPVGHGAVVPASQRAEGPPPPIGLGLGLVLSVGLGRFLIGRRRLLGRFSPAAVGLRVPVLAAATAAGRGRGAFPAAAAAAAAAALGGLGPLLAAVAVAAAGLGGLAATALSISPPVLAVALLAAATAAAAVPAGPALRPLPAPLGAGGGGRTPAAAPRSPGSRRRRCRAGPPQQQPLLGLGAHILVFHQRGHTPAATSTATAVLLRLGQREDPTLLRLLPGAGPAAPLLPPSCAPLASRQPLDLQRGARAEARGGGRGGGGCGGGRAGSSQEEQRRRGRRRLQELRLQERQQQRRLLRGQESPPLAAFLQLLLRPTQAPASPQRRVRAARHRLEPAAECGAGAASSRVRSWPSPPPETGAAAEGHRAPGPAGRRATIIRVGTRVPGFQVTVGYAAASGPQRSKNPGGGAPDRARCPIRRQRKHQMRRALTCGGVPSPPSAPGGGGAASAALSARAAQRGSTTFVAASLHRALTLGASSGEGSGRDNNTPPPPPLRRRRRPPVVAATHRRRLGSGLGLTTTPSLEPRALCGPRGWAAGRGEAGATGLRLSVEVCGAGWGAISGEMGAGAFLSLWR